MKIFKQVISLIILSSLILSCSDVWQKKEAKLETSEIESLGRITAVCDQTRHKKSYLKRLKK